MSGPYCKDCKNWYPMIRSEQGECRDRTKRIYAKYGDSVRGSRLACDDLLECAKAKPTDIWKHLQEIEEGIMRSMGVPKEMMEVKPMGTADLMRHAWREAEHSNADLSNDRRK